MTRTAPALMAAAAALFGIARFAAPGAAQPGQEPAERNLKVLPRDIPQERLMQVMQGFTRALGVQCSHCHVRGDFSSDANPNKETARGMMRMTRVINQDQLRAIPGVDADAAVSCFTCHRGEAQPATMLPAPVAAPEPAAPAGQPQQ